MKYTIEYMLTYDGPVTLEVDVEPGADLADRLWEHVLQRFRADRINLNSPVYVRAYPSTTDFIHFDLDQKIIEEKIYMEREGRQLKLAHLQSLATPTEIE